ncbi:Spidroin-1 [Streptomyces sp. HCCB10043]|nr:Spidroin-1 [Streptomyces sp. HCCB10043]
MRDVDGQHDQRGRTAGVGGAQLDPDAVTQRQPADHEQTHAAGDGDVHGRRLREPLVDRREVLGGEADAGVVDLDQDAAVGQRVTGDLDLRLRRGERRGVLQQLGEQVHEVVDDAARDLGGGHRGQLDALVLLHLGRGGAEHVDQRDGAGPPAARLLAREDEEVLAVPAHTGREVVELEERGQLVRVGLAGLQFGDERELALDEALGAAREVGEHRVDVAPEEGLLGGEADGLAVHVVEGRGHLADLVPGVHADRLDGGVDVLRVGLGELLDELGQPVLGDAGGGVLEAAQGPDHGAGHHEGADERDAEHDEDHRTVDDRVALGGLAQLAGLGLHVAQEGGLDRLHGLDLDGALVVPVQVRPDLLALDPVRRVQDPLGVHVPGVDLRVAVVQGRHEFFGALPGRRVDLLERREGAGLLGERVGAELPVVLVQVRFLDRTAGQRRGDDRALDGGVLLGGGERRQGPGPLDHVRVAGRLRHVLREAQQRGDQLAVLVDRVETRRALLVRRLADRTDGAELGGDRRDARVDALQRLVALGVTDRVGLVEEGVLGAVGLVPGPGDLVVGGLGLVRQRTGRLVALHLKSLGERGRLLGHLRQQLHVLQLLHVGHRLLDPQTAEAGRGDHREGEERDQSRTDAPVTERYSRARVDRAPRLCGRVRLRTARRGARALRTVAVVAGSGRPGVLGVLGRGTAVGPAARLLFRRSAAIPLETSLH